MPLLQVLFTAARTSGAALLLSFVLLIAVAGLAGRGTERLGWLLPIYFLAVLATFATATVSFHRSVGALLPGPVWHWLVTGVQSAFSLLVVAAVLFSTLVILNR